MTAPSVALRSEAGDIIIGGNHWALHADAVDAAVLGRCRAPVLDIGCGPGRHILALAERGLPALGIDLTPEVVAWARQRGALVLERCVFDRVPGAGRWKTAVLLDGNIGIGADPSGLLRRAAELLAKDGRVLVEVAAPGTLSPPTNARLEVDGVGGPWFPWTWVDVHHLEGHAAAAGLVTHERWDARGRDFAELRRARPRGMS
jgi:SAM-dependent methyltransferase